MHFKRFILSIKLTSNIHDYCQINYMKTIIKLMYKNT